MLLAVCKGCRNSGRLLLPLFSFMANGGEYNEIRLQGSVVNTVNVGRICSCPCHIVDGLYSTQYIVHYFSRASWVPGAEYVFHTEDPPMQKPSQSGSLADSVTVPIG